MRVAIIGGGVIGLSLAWRLAERHTVTVFDPRPGYGASWAAAGMLSPAGEAWHGEEHLLRAGLDSLARWPDFAAALTGDSGVDPWLAREGTWLAGATTDDAREVDRVVAILESHRVEAHRRSRAEVRGAEPSLHHRLRSVVDVPGDLSVHNRRLLDALRAACAVRGVRVEPELADVAVHDGSVVGVRTRHDDTLHPADAVVVAAGSRLAEVGSVPPEIGATCRPVKGQILRLRWRGPDPLLRRTLRALVGGAAVYAVPRRDGEIVLGATTEELGYDETVTVDAVHELLRAGLAVVPGLRDCELVETLARPRPGTPDNAPLVGPTGVDGLLLAAGHYRGGVLLAPLTAAAVAAHLEGSPVPQAARALLPTRLTGARA